MYTHAYKNQDTSNNKNLQKKNSGSQPSQFLDSSAKAITQRKAQQIANDSEQAGHTAQFKAMADNAPVQRLMKKLNVNKTDYTKLLRTTVYLYAEFDGEPVGDDGIFKTTSGKHAEDNLIASIKQLGLKNGSLMVYLSTSPCSSTFCTRNDGVDGCHEKLSGLGGLGIELSVNADHLYQPQAVGAMERDSGFPTGMSSYSAAATSSYDLKLSHLPKNYQDEDLIADGSVAQLIKSNHLHTKHE